MRIQVPVLENNMGFALDVGDQQLRLFREGWSNPVYRAIPVGRRLLRTVAVCNDFLPRFKVAAQARVIAQIDKTAAFGKRIDDALSAPHHLTGGDVASGDQRELAIRLDIHGFEVADECPVRAGCDTYAYRAARCFQSRELLLDSPDKRHLIR